ncbi:uncharacterized protein LOC144556426 isoform X2 [Carex rostrata]
MTSVLPSHPTSRPIRVQKRSYGGQSNKLRLLCLPRSSFANGRKLVSLQQKSPYDVPLLRAVSNGSTGEGSSDGEDEDQEKTDKEEVNYGISREDLERMVGADDLKFSGLDLANLIREKYGRSYDVQLIRKRSFPLSEEEYILRLDDVANNLKCWGAVSHVQSSLAKTKERPRIGKAVSIFIDMDESGGRSREWIYK